MCFVIFPDGTPSCRFESAVNGYSGIIASTESDFWVEEVSAKIHLAEFGKIAPP